MPSPDSLLIAVQELANLTPAQKYYWRYQFEFGTTFLVEYLRDHGAFQAGSNVCDVGCGEGGVLAAFLVEGAVNCLGTDIDAGRLQSGRYIGESLGLDIGYHLHNIVTQPPEPEWQNQFDLILLRDVIEHLDDPNPALVHMYQFLKPGGYIYVSFPPYYSAFGGHQHNLGTKSGKVPFMHLLPKVMIKSLLRKAIPREANETMRLRDIRLTASKFRNAAKAAGFELTRQEYYLIRPVYKQKFNLPAVSLTPIKWLPGVQTFSAMEACFIIRKPVSEVAGTEQMLTGGS